MAVKRKVQSKIFVPKKEEAAPLKQAEVQVEEGAKPRAKKFCHFCKTHTEPAYFDTQALRRCLNDRGRIIPRQRTGTCAKHQRRVGREIKRARHMAILPFTVRI